jgi:hypothetical protein
MTVTEMCVQVPHTIESNVTDLNPSWVERDPLYGDFGSNNIQEIKNEAIPVIGRGGP